MIHLVVNYHKTVVGTSGNFHLNRWILGIVSFYINFQCGRNTHGIDNRFNAGLSLIKPFQDCIIHIIVYQNNPFSGQPYQITDKRMCVKDLTIVENALYGNGFF